MGIVFLKSKTVRSSWLDALAFVARGRKTGIAVLFKNGFSCVYWDLDQRQYENWLRSVSKGKYLYKRGFYWHDYEEITFDS